MHVSSFGPDIQSKPFRSLVAPVEVALGRATGLSRKCLSNHVPSGEADSMGHGHLSEGSTLVARGVAFKLAQMERGALAWGIDIRGECHM